MASDSNDDGIEDIIQSDYELILKLEEEGPSFFDRCYRSECFKKHEKKILDYEKLFLKEELFEGSLETYMKYLCDNDTMIWKKLTKSLTGDEIVEYLSKFLDYGKQLPFEDKLNFYSKVLLNTDPEYVIHDSLWNYQFGIDLQKNTFFGDLISSVKIDNEDNDGFLLSTLSKINTLFGPLFKNEDVRNCFVTWTANVYNANTMKINLSPDYQNLDKLSSDCFLYNLHIVIILMWYEAFLSSENNKIIDNCKYISDKNCPIKWYDKKDYGNDINYTPLDQYFFLALNSTRVYYLPMIQRYDNWLHLLEELKAVKSQLQTSLNFMSAIILPQVDKKIKFVQEVIDESDIIISDSVVSEFMSELYEFFMSWVKDEFSEDGKDVEFEMNDILENIINFTEEFKDGSISFKFIDFALLITSSNKYTNNTYLQHKYIIEIYHCLDQHIHTNLNIDEFITMFVNSIIKNHNEIDKIDDYLDTKLFKKMKLYKILHQLLSGEQTLKFIEYQLSSNSDSSELVKSSTELIDSNTESDNSTDKPINELNTESDNSTDYSSNESFYIDSDYYDNINEIDYDNIIKGVVSDNKLPSIKFISILLNDCFKVNEFIDEGYKLVSQFIIGTRQHKKQCVILYDIIRHYNKMINFMSLLLNIDAFIKIIVSDEIINTFASVMNDSIKRFVKTFNCKIDFIKPGFPDDPSKEFCMNELILELIRLCEIVYEKDENFAKILVSDEISYSLANYITATEHIHENFEADIIVAELIEFVGKLQDAEKDIHNVPSYDEEIPDEFLDPLTYEPIEDPMLLPGGNGDSHDMFIERSIILKQLLHKEENPFTRDKITRDDIEEYNSRDNIKEKLVDFVKRFGEWKENHKVD
jgi:hypothetical protein